MPLTAEEILQRNYYAAAAQSYGEGYYDEHALALAHAAALIKFHGFESVLDVGAGTGRAQRELNRLCPGVRCIGIEPVKELREVGHTKGLTAENLIDGRGDQLSFENNSFDVASEFGVLHHVAQPRAILREMSRVARKMVVISDCNVIGQGSFPARCLKRILFGLHLWPVFNWIKSGGKGYYYSEGDGVYYSYSVFQDVPYLRNFWKNIYAIPTNGGGGDDGSVLTNATHAMIVCLDKIN